MRFIGCKKNLLNNIDLFINSKCKNSQVFCDLYAGTGTVSNYFKNKYKIISNDILYFSFCILKGTIELNETPKFEKLVKVINNSDIKKYDDNVSIVIDYLNNINYKDYNGPKFIYNNYSPAGKRMYIQEDNALKIDCIRNTIEKWHLNNLISDLEYYYLIGCMIEDIPSISNISGTYGAFLKTWDVRTYKRYDIKPLEILSNKFENEVFNKDGKELLKEIKGDILYLDPPYNARQYLPNYHLLETVAKYDNPKVKGITGVREYKNEKSNWCIKSTVKQEFEDIVSLANFKYIVLSYNSEGLMSKEDIEVIMKKYGKANTFECVEIPYRRFRSRSVNGKGGVTEYLFFIEKSKKNSKSTPETKIKSNYVKSPLNYTGGKYKLLPNIIKLLPKDIDTFYDIFGGGFNVGANVCAKKIVYNDMNSFLTDILLTFSSLSYEDIIENIESIIKQYDLSEENVEGYNLLRDDYNSNPNSLKLFVLTCYAFNHQIRFNNSKKFNTPFGKERSSFNSNIKSNLESFCKLLKSKQINYYSEDFTKFYDFKYNPSDLVYCDPPYLITNGSYNDGNRGFKDWTDKEDKELMNYLDYLNSKNIKFVLSNVFKHKGLENSNLEKWAQKYNVVYLNKDYKNCNYHKKNKNSETIEVLIYNFEDSNE